MTTSWQQEMRDALKSSDHLQSFFNETIDQVSYPSMIPKSFAKRLHSSDALKKQFLPNQSENRDEGLIDPIADHKHAKIKRLVHRYPNRVLFLPTDVCPILCRYCFRKNELGLGDELFKPGNQQEIYDYLVDHPKVEEVIFTGGDPLILTNKKLDEYLAFFATIANIKMIRFHSRTPVILPQRIDDEFLQVLQKYRHRFPIMTLVIHTNHKDEWSDEFAQTCKKLAKSPLNLLSQSVLLKGVNDQAVFLKELFYGLVELGIRPYYLHHPDPAKGAMHFYLSKEEGLAIYQQLKEQVSGWALPHYVCEQEDGQGKVLTSSFPLQKSIESTVND
jgi:lysine 2,3-aminomutase